MFNDISEGQTHSYGDGCPPCSECNFSISHTHWIGCSHHPNKRTIIFRAATPLEAAIDKYVRDFTTVQKRLTLTKSELRAAFEEVVRLTKEEI